MNTPFTYVQSEPGLWTVGHYDPAGNWVAESDHNTRDKAAARVHYLSGGTEREPAAPKQAGDGGPAFPRPVSAITEAEAVGSLTADAQEGMTLRDYFAAAALTGIVGSYSGADVQLPPEGKSAKWAYEYADAMLRQRAPAPAAAEREGGAS